MPRYDDSEELLEYIQEKPWTKAPIFTFVHLDQEELCSSRERSRDAWQKYKDGIERQVQDFFDPKPDAEELESLARWEKLSPVLILYGVPPDAPK
ncbi:hypothetical protein HY489_03360 [Candidatus Woesearchaeota archaeon]|nr:hypothetical protein [Candidatus Woesearchaeota archaeon]